MEERSYYSHLRICEGIGENKKMCSVSCKYFENSWGLYLCLNEGQRNQEYEYFSPYFDTREEVLPCPFEDIPNETKTSTLEER